MIIGWTSVKWGNGPDENEDAWKAEPGILVMADGATEAFASGLWARLLVEHLAQNVLAYRANPSQQFWADVDAARVAWTAWLHSAHLQWNERQAAARGSAAAVLVLLIQPRARRVIALSIGDVIVVRLRTTAPAFAWPLTMASAFSHSPPLVGSQVLPHGQVEQCTTTYQAGDRFLIMTDALAAWALHCDEQNAPIWEHLAALPDTAAWERFVMDARAAGMKNDDVTVVVWESRRQRRVIVAKER